MSPRRISPETPLYEALYVEIRRRDITQLEAAIEVGVSKQVMHNWLIARHVPSEHYTSALAKFLRTTPEVVRRMTERERTVDRLIETERIQRETLKELQRALDELATLRAALTRAGLLDDADDPSALDASR